MSARVQKLIFFFIRRLFAVLHRNDFIARNVFICFAICSMHKKRMETLFLFLATGNGHFVIVPYVWGATVCRFHDDHVGHADQCHLEWRNGKNRGIEEAPTKSWIQNRLTTDSFTFQGIEQLKKEEASWVRKSRWKSIQSVFGRFSIAWFSPFTKPALKSKLDRNFYSV